MEEIERFRSAVERVRTEIAPALALYVDRYVDGLQELREAVAAIREETVPEEYQAPDPDVFDTQPESGSCPMVVLGDEIPKDLRGWVR